MLEYLDYFFIIILNIFTKLAKWNNLDFRDFLSLSSHLTEIMCEYLLSG